MLEALRAALEADRRIAYAIVFGSGAKGSARPDSDVDVAIGIAGPSALDILDLGALTAALETTVGRPVELVLLDEAPPGLAYRVFRDGITVVSHDKPALAARRARAVLEYLDFQPFEELCARGVLAAAHGR